MMVIFDKSDSSVPGGNGFSFEAQAYKDACLDDPCKGAPCTITDNEDGYECEFRSKLFSYKLTRDSEAQYLSNKTVTFQLLHERDFTDFISKSFSDL